MRTIKDDDDNYNGDHANYGLWTMVLGEKVIIVLVSCFGNKGKSNVGLTKSTMVSGPYMLIMFIMMVIMSTMLLLVILVSVFGQQRRRWYLVRICP